MKTMKFKRSRLIPNLSNKENKRLFWAMNFALIIGGASLISTFLYFILNFDKADNLLLICLSGLVFGIVLMILYAIGHHKLAKIEKPTRFKKSVLFSR